MNFDFYHYRKDLLRFNRRRFPSLSEEELEDLIADVLLKLTLKHDKFDPDKKVKVFTWLNTCVRNHFIQHFVRKKQLVLSNEEGTEEVIYMDDNNIDLKFFGEHLKKAKGVDQALYAFFLLKMEDKLHKEICKELAIGNIRYSLLLDELNEQWSIFNSE